MVESNFPTSGLSAEYGDIVMTNVVAAVSVEISHAGVVILSESYTPDSTGTIRIREVGELAMLYFDSNDFADASGEDGDVVVLSITLTEGAQVISKNVTFYPCIVDFSGSLSTADIVTIPLSRSIKKETGIGRKEYISFYGGQTVKAYIVYKSTTDVGVTHDLIVLANAAKFYRVNVSPSVIAALAGVAESDIVYYNIYTSEEFIIRFTVSERNYPFQKTFVFRNCFGAQESFTCIGDEIAERKWTREFGSINKKEVQVSRDLEAKFKVNTGLVTDNDLEVIEDLLHSDQICIIDEFGFQEVVILEENFSDSSRKDEVESVDFTYRLSQHNQFKTSYKAFRKPRIFTPDFDRRFE